MRRAASTSLLRVSGRDGGMPVFVDLPQPLIAAAAILGLVVVWTSITTGAFGIMAGILVSLLVGAMALVLIRMIGWRRREAVVTTGLVHAQAASENRLRLLAEHTADMIVETDSDLVWRFVSRSSMTLLGYAPDELVGSPASDLIHPDDLCDYHAALAKLHAGRQDRIVATHRYRRKDGSYLWTENHIQVVRHAETGEPAGYVESLRDVSERRAGEAALRESEAVLRGVIDSSPDGVHVLDRLGIVSFASRDGLGRFGFEADAIGCAFADLWPPALRREIQSAVATAASGTPSQCGGTIEASPGGRRFLQILVMPIAGSSGRPDRLLAVTRDVTQATEAESALKQSHERYRLLAENASDLVLLRATGADGRMLFVSPSCRRLLGYDPEALASARLSELVHRDDREGVDAILGGLDEGDGTVVHTHRMRRADGAVIWVEGAFRRAEWLGETVIVAAFRDVTERQNRAEALRVAKETAETAQKTAEQANEAKSDFLAVVSHEIRTPLNSIIGFTDLMLDSGELPLRAQRHAELIQSAGSALLTLVNDLLDFAKVEAGAVELESLPFQPEELAQHCAAIVRGYAGTKALDIEVETAGSLPSTLMGDEARLRQILLNLLNNAVKFTQSGRVTLRVSNLGVARCGVTLRFEVADTGIGIAEAKLHRLFERFSQADTSVARRFGGTGLGLAISKKLVALMGGKIGVSSREGLGSTFWFTVTLPVQVEVRTPALVASAPQRAGRILLVEDIEINQRLAVALLESAGHAIDIASNGAEAVKAASEGVYDLILMDVQMPIMDGMTATRAIRASDAPGRGVTIVAMTANVFPEQIEAFRVAGMDDHVAKPLNRSQLHATVTKWLNRAPDVTKAEEAVSAVFEPTGSFDVATFERLSLYMGRVKLDDILSRFEASLPWRFSGGDEGPEAVRRWMADAHVVLSVAGMTGFSDLAGHCRSLQSAPPGSAVFWASLGAARAARDDAVRTLASLRRTLATAAE